MNLDQLGESKEAVVAWRRMDALTGTAGGTTYTVAADEVLKEVETNAESPDVWRRLASIYRRAGRSVGAASVARNAIRRSPQIAPHTIALVEELLDQEPQAIVTLMEELVALDRQNGRYVHLLGAARLKAGHLPEAVEALREACNLDRENASYWYALGKAFEEAGNRDAAQAAYEKAVQYKPNYTKARLAQKRLTSGGAASGKLGTP